MTSSGKTLTALPAWLHTRSPAGRVLNAEPA